ncbi:hypothetical protein [Mycobacterium alsense]|uniref:hypothetical protein n=1 Tax=Mycobacterium alsense TaxID=324058 RepID=UPI000B155E24|nr:hypothetical protein [Mycobacterium alsense]
MTISLRSRRSLRNAAAGAIGAGALAGAMFFGGVPVANAAPPPAPATSFATVGPHGPGVIPVDHHWWHHGWGHHGWGHGWGHPGRFLWHNHWWNWWW